MDARKWVGHYYTTSTIQGGERFSFFDRLCVSGHLKNIHTVIYSSNLAPLCTSYAYNKALRSKAL